MDGHDSKDSQVLNASKGYSMKRHAHVRDGDEIISKILCGERVGDQVWRREHLSPINWTILLPEACLAELDEVVRRFRKHPRPVQHVTPEAFPLTACAAVMAQVRSQLAHGIGLAVLDRIPVECYSVTENKAIGWLLAMLLGQVVAQAWDGTTLYDVKDSGKSLGHGVRRSVTNLAQPFHTDGGWLWRPPAYVGLFCLQAAQAGGFSRFVNLMTVHHEMRSRHPDLLARLYRPFWWDRQAEHGPDDRRFCRHPVYQHDGQALMARYYEDYIYKGHQLAGEPLDDAGAEALAAMRGIIDTPENWVEFRMEQGQLQYINNRQFAHARTAFIDPEGAQAQRHMVRLWNRDEGTPHLEG
jgi:alpha-ketoglutarate-dependent taurine dioxygenase